jgi:hypothetical protein
VTPVVFNKQKRCSQGASFLRVALLFCERGTGSGAGEDQQAYMIFTVVMITDGILPAKNNYL